MTATKKPGYLIEPRTAGPTSKWESHHATNPTVVRLSCDPRVFLGYRAGGDDDLYYLRHTKVWSSHLGLAVLDRNGGAVTCRFPLPIFTLDKERNFPKSKEEFERYAMSDRRNETVTLHDFRFWEDQDWLYLIYHDGSLEQAFDCIVRMASAAFVRKVDESITLLESGVSPLDEQWREIWWHADVWEPCGVDGTNRIYPSRMSKNDIIHLRLIDGTLLMYHRPVPDIAVLVTAGQPYPPVTADGMTMVGHLQNCIRPGFRDNSHIGNNGAPITVRIGSTPVALDVAHGVYNEALSDDSVTQKWKLLYYPYLRLLDLETGQCLYYSSDPVLEYDPTWETYDKNGKWVAVAEHLDGVMFAGGTVPIDADQNGVDDLYRSYIGVGDTAVAVAEFCLRDVLPPAVIDDIASLPAHRKVDGGEVSENRHYFDESRCGWRWSLANGDGRTIVIRRELEQSGESEDRPIETRPGFFDADCLSVASGYVTMVENLGWVVTYTGCRWDQAHGERSTHFGTGVVVLDRNLPERVLYRSDEPIAGSAGVVKGWLRVISEASSANAASIVPAKVREEIARLYRLNPLPSDMIRWLQRKSAASAPAKGPQMDSKHSDVLFDWQRSVDSSREAKWAERQYNEDKWWGEFPREAAHGVPDWALGPFTKYEGNPILDPTPGSWDCGHFDGGVHNGSVIVADGRFFYVYRGEREHDYGLAATGQNYQCDIGLAVSDNGIDFTKDDEHSPFFAHGSDVDYSFEDVCLVKHESTYYLYCNRWNWYESENPRESGVFLATSDNLTHWTKHGIVFPDATRIHRNPVVLQDPSNRAVRLPDGKFMMFINGGIVAYSDDLIHWESKEIGVRWPGGEGCVAMCRHRQSRPDDVILFTGGHHTGHFYAIGEVLLSLKDPETPRDFLKRPILHAETKYPYEHGYLKDGSEKVSSLSDCIFFNGITRHQGRWWVYYGGSEYYTCLATAPAQ